MPGTSDTIAQWRALPLKVEGTSTNNETKGKITLFSVSATPGVISPQYLFFKNNMLLTHYGSTLKRVSRYGHMLVYLEIYVKEKLSWATLKFHANR